MGCSGVSGGLEWRIRGARDREHWREGGTSGGGGWRPGGRLLVFGRG